MIPSHPDSCSPVPSFASNIRQTCHYTKPLTHPAGTNPCSVCYISTNGHFAEV